MDKKDRALLETVHPGHDDYVTDDPDSIQRIINFLHFEHQVPFVEIKTIEGEVLTINMNYISAIRFQRLPWKLK